MTHMSDELVFQISKRFYWDDRLSFNARGVWGVLSLHREGITLDTILCCCNDKDSTVVTALAELKTVGYITEGELPDGTPTYKAVMSL